MKKKFYLCLGLMLGLAITAQEAPKPEVAAAPAKPEAQAPAPQKANPLQPQAADMTSVKVHVVYQQEGVEKVAEVKPGTLRSAGIDNMGSAFVKGFLTFGLAGSLENSFEAFGNSADVMVTPKVTEIRLEGYSPKTMGMNGTITLIQPKVDKEKRVFGINGGSLISGGFKNKIEKTHIKKVAKNQLVKKDNAWVLEIQGELAPGPYMLVTPEIPFFYWDFDVK
jgi:hypothetical protein